MEKWQFIVLALAVIAMLLNIIFVQGRPLAGLVFILLFVYFIIGVIEDRNDKRES